jgi:IS5 family transposase
MINLKHPLVKLADLMDRELIENAFETHFESTMVRPALCPRWVLGPLYLQHPYVCSDEEIVNIWMENPYYSGHNRPNGFVVSLPHGAWPLGIPLVR